MFLDIGSEDTICALATPSGRSGVALIRVSGSDSYRIARKMSPKLPEFPESHKSYFSKLYDQQGEIIDHALVCYFADKRSFTGEKSVEISCHGSPYVISSLLKELTDLGCRSARPGEFSQRAFMNGKMDLVQVESVLSLIEAKSSASSRLAIRQLEGGFSSEVHWMEDKLCLILANFEASIDFTEEDIEIIDYDQVDKLLKEIFLKLDKLISSYRKGKVISEGLRLALIGLPNAGKSSLLNALAKQDKAIVSDIPGTTRDVIEVDIHINGLSIRLLDTAGIRETSDHVESLGVSRSLSSIDSADVVFYLVDASSKIDTWFSEEFISKISNKNSHLIVTKCDLVKDKASLSEAIDEQLKVLEKERAIQFSSTHLLSTLDPDSLDSLMDFLHQLSTDYLVDDSAVVQNNRHYELLCQVRSRLEAAEALIRQKESVEFISVDFYEAIYKLGEIVGKRFDDEVMDRVFKEFCIGK